MSYKSKSHNKHIKKRASNDVSFISLVKDGALGALASIVIAVVLAAILSAASLLYKDPAILSLPIGIGILYISSLLGGMISASRYKSDKNASYLCGIICGCVILILFGIISTVIGLTPIGSPHSLKLLLSVILRVLCIPFSFLGAYATVSLNRSKRSHPRRR